MPKFGSFRIIHTRCICHVWLQQTVVLQKIRKILSLQKCDCLPQLHMSNISTDDLWIKWSNCLMSPKCFPNLAQFQLTIRPSNICWTKMRFNAKFQIQDFVTSGFRELQKLNSILIFMNYEVAIQFELIQFKLLLFEPNFSRLGHVELCWCRSKVNDLDSS